MTIADIRKEIIAVIKESTEREIEITEETHIVNEMNLSSIETMMMVSDLEDRFEINIPTAQLRNVRTVKDLCDIVVDTLME